MHACMHTYIHTYMHTCIHHFRPGALAAEVGKRLGSRPPAPGGPGVAASAQSATAFQASERDNWGDNWGQH